MATKTHAEVGMGTTVSAKRGLKLMDFQQYVKNTQFEYIVDLPSISHLGHSRIKIPIYSPRFSKNSRDDETSKMHQSIKKLQNGSTSSVATRLY